MVFRRTALWIAVSFLILVYVVWINVDIANISIHESGTHLFKLVAGIISAYLLNKRAQLDSSIIKSPWFFYALGALFYSVGQLYLTMYYIYYNAAPETWGFFETFGIGQCVAYIIALGYHISKNIKLYSAFRYYLDILIFTICAVSLYWHYFLEPNLTESIYSNFLLMQEFILSTLNAGIVFGLLFFYFGDRFMGQMKTLILLIITFSFKTVASTILLHLVLSGSEDALWTDISNLSLFAGQLFLGIAALSDMNSPVQDKHSQSFAKVNNLKKYTPFFFILLMLLAFVFGIQHPSALLLGSTFTIVALLVRLWISLIGFRTAQRALSEAERKYRNLVENSQVGVFAAQYGKLTYVNRYFADTFGLTPEGMIGTSFMHYFDGEDRQKLAVEISSLAMNFGFTSHIGVKGIKSDGSGVHLEVQVTRTVKNDDVIITGTLLNITQRKIAEEAVIRSEKLSVVGQLAAGVAHEIRNPLTSLRGFTQLLKARADNENDNNYYEIMLTELDRINYIVGEFMLLSKPQQMQTLAMHDLKELLGSMLPIIETQAIIHNIVIEVDWKANIPSVLCDKNQIKQVFVNILKNAIESMHHGGTIRVKFYRGRDGKSCVAIRDQGPGMPEEILARLGEPFFSTKNTGTGLGLMVCYRIIEAHQGELHITSQKNMGTIVDIRFHSAESRNDGEYGLFI